jgi:DnaJ-class molecular chaperone
MRHGVIHSRPFFNHVSTAIRHSHSTFITQIFWRQGASVKPRKVKCPMCKGKGTLNVSKFFSGSNYLKSVTCNRCGGRGKI